MAKRFPPRADGPAVECLQHFADGIAANPGMYMLGLPDAETISRVVREFADAFRVSSNKATRSSTDVSAKDKARWSAEKLCQGYHNRIQANFGISNEDKIAIGVNPLNFTRTKIFVQRSSPTLTIVAATPLAHMLRYADSLTPNRAAKVYGAQHLELHAAIGDTIATSPQEARFIGHYARNLFHVKFKPEDRGKTATYWGRWAGKRHGDVGMWSLPVSMTIAA